VIESSTAEAAQQCGRAKGPTELWGRRWLRPEGVMSEEPEEGSRRTEGVVEVRGKGR
jgi:hypothetical protein